MIQSDISSRAWQNTVARLDAGCAHQFRARVREIVNSQASGNVASGNVGVSFALLDRISPRTATLSWSDPQCCKYGEQVWRLATPKHAGTCVLSGEPIASGQAIYRMNPNAMLLAEVLEKCLPPQSAIEDSAGS